MWMLPYTIYLRYNQYDSLQHCKRKCPELIVPLRNKHYVLSCILVSKPNISSLCPTTVNQSSSALTCTDHGLHIIHHHVSTGIMAVYILSTISNITTTITLGQGCTLMEVAENITWASFNVTVINSMEIVPCLSMWLITSWKTIKQD
jgi:hypothetical protein